MPRKRNDGLPAGVEQVSPDLYRVRVRRADGTWTKKSGFATASEAARHRRINLDDYAAGRLTEPETKGSVPTFGEYYLGKFTRKLALLGRAPKTMADKTGTFKRQLQDANWVDLPLDQITSQLLEEWFTMRATGELPPEPESGYQQFETDLKTMRVTTDYVLKKTLRLVKYVFYVAVADSSIPISTNPAAILVLPQPDKEEKAARNRAHRLRKLAHIIELANIPLIVSALDYVDLLPFWLCLIGGLRISETFGLRVGDWEPEHCSNSSPRLCSRPR